ncbi:hypothetical protein BDR07DRAFT_1486392 [Suillus spraguei]|nr:hypothetical protein BDR07DRAFT_1486392 [Suillus spraguei]
MFVTPYFEFALRAFPDAAVLLLKGASLPQDDALDSSLTCSDSPMNATTDTSLTIVPSASASTRDTSLGLLDPLPSLSELSAALLGQEMPHATSDTSLTHTLQPAYNFFQYSPPNTQDDTGPDLDFNDTILPMPPNYKLPSPLPPSSPLLSLSPSSQTDQLPSLWFSFLASTSRTGYNILFSDAGEFHFADPYRNGFDDTTLQSLTSPPHLRHLSSTLTNTAHNQHHSSPPYNNTPTPMEIPAPAHTPTAVELPNSAEPVVPESLTLGPIMAAPAAIGGTLPVTTTASKCKSTKNNTENLETVSVKRQKKGGAVVVSTENSQYHVEGGQGKQQHFQSSRAAAANAIGA